MRNWRRSFPLEIAFWLREGDEGEWYLYLVSGAVDSQGVGPAYQEVLRILPPGSKTWLDPFQVKVLGTNQPLAQAFLEREKKYPTKIVKWLRRQSVNRVFVDEAFVYPADFQARTTV